MMLCRRGRYTQSYAAVDNNCVAVDAACYASNRELL